MIKIFHFLCQKSQKSLIQSAETVADRGGFEAGNLICFILNGKDI